GGPELAERVALAAVQLVPQVLELPLERGAREAVLYRPRLHRVAPAQVPLRDAERGPAVTDCVRIEARLVQQVAGDARGLRTGQPFGHEELDGLLRVTSHPGPVLDAGDSAGGRRRLRIRVRRAGAARDHQL